MSTCFAAYPLDPPKKVGRNFGLEYETEAYRWLDEERYLLTSPHG